METTTIIIFLVLLVSLFSFIAYLENNNKPKLLFYKEHKNLITMGIISLILVLFLFGYLMSDDVIERKNIGVPLLVFVIILKIIMIRVIVKESKKLGWNSFLWGILGLIAPFLSLIVLGANPKLVNTNSSSLEQKVNNLNSETIEKQKSINTARKNNIIDVETESKKLNELRKEYNVKLKSTLSEDKEDVVLNQLKNALNVGVLTQEEYDEKIKKHLNRK